MLPLWLWWMQPWKSSRGTHFGPRNSLTWPSTAEYRNCIQWFVYQSLPQATMSLFSTVLVSPHSRVCKESCYSRGADLCDLKRIWIWDWREMVYLPNITHDGHMPSLHRHSYLVWYKHHACNPRYHASRQAPIIMFVNTPTLAERDPLHAEAVLSTWFCPSAGPFPCFRFRFPS